MNYNGLKNTARKLISSNGSPCSIESIVGQSYNSMTHNYENEVELITGCAIRTFFNEKDINGTTILQGDVLFNFVPDNGMDKVPTTQDFVIFGGERYQIINVNTVSPNGDVTICYKLQGRK